MKSSGATYKLPDKFDEDEYEYADKSDQDEYEVFKSKRYQGRRAINRSRREQARRPLFYVQFGLSGMSGWLDSSDPEDLLRVSGMASASGVLFEKSAELAELVKAGSNSLAISSMVAAPASRLRLKGQWTAPSTRLETDDWIEAGVSFVYDCRHRKDWKVTPGTALINPSEILVLAPREQPASGPEPNLIAPSQLPGPLKAFYGTAVTLVSGGLVWCTLEVIAGPVAPGVLNRGEGLIGFLGLMGLLVEIVLGFVADTQETRHDGTWSQTRKAR